ncbi:hypothetical protein HY636_00505 [Candidatus Woesearchaeota archaeon]|nr:hypothetical protein [Candidatus Woesearchaeota archaeon]
MEKLKEITKKDLSPLAAGCLAGVITLVISAPLFYFTKDMSVRAELSRHYPELIDIQYSLTQEERASLESILTNKATSHDVGETNVCSFGNYTNFSIGCCTFISQEWVLLSYHELSPEFYHGQKDSPIYAVVTTKKEIIHSAVLGKEGKPDIHMEIVCASPRQDLALLKVMPNYYPIYIGKVALPEDVPEVQNGLTYLYPHSDGYNLPKVSKMQIPTATMVVDDLLPFEFAQFVDEAKLGEGKIGNGTSGGPVYQGNYLRGIMVKKGNKPNTAMYSPNIRGFLERCLKEQ